MKLKGFMEDAYQGRLRSRKLETRKGEVLFSLQDLADRVGTRPSRSEVEALAPDEDLMLSKLISTKPEKKHQQIWGYLTSIAAERISEPLRLPGWDFSGLELSCGTIILEGGGNHVGERMRGGRIFVRGKAGAYLGQEISGGGIVAESCGDYAFRNMRGGWGVILGDAGSSLGLGNSGGRIVVRGSCGERAGWLMHGGSLRISGEAGNYLGLLMSGGKILVRGRAGSRAGWRMKAGSIKAKGFGPGVGEGAVGGSILATDS